jgi:hypothetical protein
LVGLGACRPDKTSRVGPLLKQIATFLLRARSRSGPPVHARRVFIHRSFISNVRDRTVIRRSRCYGPTWRLQRHVMRPPALPAPSGTPSGRGFSLTGRDQYCSLWRDMQVVASDRWRVQRRLPSVHPPHAVITTACGAFHFTTRSPCMGVSPRRATAKSCCAFANF